MPTWAWWGLISVGLCGLAWLCGRWGRPHSQAGYGPWGTSWAVYFSPQGGALQAILKNIQGAKRTILVQAYVFHSTRLAGALVRAHRRGIHVQVMLDAGAQPHRPPVPAVARLTEAGIAVFLDDRHAWAHDKVMILDGEIVITGSYNWTVTAENDNGENLLVIRDPRLAECYTENWRRHAQHSTRYRPTVPWRVRVRGWLARRRSTLGPIGTRHRPDA